MTSAEVRLSVGSDKHKEDKLPRQDPSLGIVERRLADAKVEAVSTDLRFIAAFNAALCIATMALRATGHRTVTQAGHHVKTIESLELTLKPNAKIVQKFKTFNNKRHPQARRM